MVKQGVLLCPAECILQVRLAAWNVIWLVIVPAFRQLVLCQLYSVRQPAQNGMAGRVMEPPQKYLEHIKNI